MTADDDEYLDELQQELAQLENALDVDDDDALFAMLDEIHERNVEELEEFDESDDKDALLIPLIPSARRFEDDIILESVDEKEAEMDESESEAFDPIAGIVFDDDEEPRTKELNDTLKWWSTYDTDAVDKATEDPDDLDSMKEVVGWWSSNTEYKPPSHKKFDSNTKKAMKVNKTFDKYKIEAKELSAEKKAKELESSLKWLQFSTTSYQEDINEFEYNQGTFKKVNELFGRWTPKGTSASDYDGSYDPRENPKDAQMRAKDLKESLSLFTSGAFDTNHPKYNCSVINRLQDLFADWRLKEKDGVEELEDGLGWWKLNAAKYNPLTASTEETEMFLKSKKMLAMFGLKEGDDWDKRNEEVEEALFLWKKYKGKPVDDLDEFTVGKMKKVKDTLLQMEFDSLVMSDMKDMAKDMDDVLSWYLDKGYKIEDLSKVNKSYKAKFKQAQGLMSLWGTEAAPSTEQLKEIAESLITLRHNEYNPEIFDNPAKFDAKLDGDAGAKFERLQEAMIDWRMKGAKSDTITSEEGEALGKGIDNAMDWWVANGENFDFETAGREQVFMAQMVKSTLDMWIPLGPEDIFTYKKSRDAVDEIKEVLALYRDTGKNFDVSSLNVKSSERASLLKLKDAMLEWRRGNATNISQAEAEQTAKEMISAMNWWKKKGKDYDVVADRMETAPVMLRHKEVVNALEEFHEDFGAPGQTPFQCLSRKEQKKVVEELDESVSWWKRSGKKIDTTQAEEDFKMFGKARRLSQLWWKANMDEDERESLCEAILSDIAWLRNKDKPMDLDSVPGDKPNILRELFKAWDSPRERSSKATAKDIEGAISWWRGNGFALKANSSIRSDNENIEKLVQMTHQYSDFKNKNEIDPNDMGWFRKEIIQEISDTLDVFDEDEPPKTDFAGLAPKVASEEQKRAQEMSSALDWLRSNDAGLDVDDDSGASESIAAEALDWLRSNDAGLDVDDDSGASESIAAEGFGGDDSQAPPSALDWLRSQAAKKEDLRDDGTEGIGALPGRPLSDEQKRANEMANALDWLRSNEADDDDGSNGEHELNQPVVDTLEVQVPEEISIILETATREASHKSKLRTETKQFLDTLHGYLVCRGKMDARYKEVDEFQIIANHVIKTDTTEMRASEKDPLLYNSKYQQQSVHGRSVETLSELYEAAEQTKPIYQEIVHEAVRKLQLEHSEEVVGVTVKLCDLKGKQRSQEKAEDDYAKRRPRPGVSWLYDIVRGSVEFTSAQHVIEFLDLIKQEPSIRIVKAKNRFTEPSLTGYRDLNIQFQVDTGKGFYHTCELQIHHKAIKELGVELHTHMYYEFFRSYFAGATASLKERLEVLKLISAGGAIDDSFLTELLQTSNDVERLERLGVLFRDQLCEYQWAFRVFVRLFEIQKEHYGTRHPEVARSYSDMALVLKEQGKLDEAMALYQECLGIYKDAYGDTHATVANVYFNTAMVLKEQDSLEQALDLFRQSLAIDRSNMSENSLSVANTYNHMATVLRKQGSLDKAMDLFKTSLGIKRDVLGEVDSSIADTLQNIAIILKQQDQLEESQRMFQESIDIATKSMGENHSSVAVGYRNMALVLEKQGKLSPALEFYEKSLDIYKKNVGEKHLLVADIYNDMAYSYKLQGDKGKAKGLLLKSLNIKKKIFNERVIEAGLRKKIANQRRELHIRPRIQRVVTA